VKRERDTFKRSLLRKWGVRYVSLCLIPLSVFLVFAIYSSSALLSALRESNEVSLSYISSQIDQAIDQCTALSEDVLLSSEVATARYSGKDATSQDLYEATTALRHLLNGYECITDALIFSVKDDMYISSMRWGSVGEITQRDEMGLAMSGDVFRKEATQMEIHDASYSLYDGTRIIRMLVLRPLSFVRSASNSYVLAAVIDASSLLPKDLPEWHNFMIVRAKDGTVLFDSQGILAHGEVLSRGKDGSNISSMFTKGNLITEGHSKHSGLEYFISVSKESYYRYIRVVVIAAFILLFASTATVAVAIWRSLKNEWRNYEKAIKSLGDDIDRSKGEKDAYAPFAAQAERFREKEELMGSVIEAQTKSLKENMLSKLVDGGVPVSREALQECGIEFISELFSVVLFETDGSEGTKKEIEKALNDGSMQTIEFPSSRALAFIVSPKDESGYYREIAKKVKSLMASNSSIIRSSSSDVSKGIQTIGSDYLDAINALEYMAFSNSSDFMISRDVEGVHNKIGFSYSTEDELKLQQAIEEADAMKCESLLEGLIDENRRNGASQRALRYLLFSVIGTTIRTRNRLMQQYAWDLPEITPKTIMQSDSISSSIEDVNGMLSRMAERIREQKNESADYEKEGYILYKKALKLIQNEYSSVDLNVNYASEKLGTSNVHLSKAFKKYHGDNISAYLTKYRIMASKKMLSNGASVGQTASSCGFGSLRTFLRVFKESEGITPSQFKDMRKEVLNGEKA